MPERGQRLVIFNADDFGLTADVNAGIIGAHRRGPVRSASLMVTTPGFADAVALARRHPTLDLGVHLALTGVAPLLPPERVPSLAGRDGCFPPLMGWLPRVLGGRLRPAEVRAELGAQLERALATGLPFSHLDGHHHVHLFPPVTPIVRELARRHGIPVVRRVGRAPWGLWRTEGAPAAAKEWLLARAEARSDRGTAGDAARGKQGHPPWRTDAFRGYDLPATEARWRRFVHALPPGVTEVMCHPGLHDEAVRGLDPYVEGREVELRRLGDPRLSQLLNETGVVVTSFAELAGARRGAAS